MKRPEVKQRGWWLSSGWVHGEFTTEEPESKVVADFEAIVLDAAAFDAYCAEVEEQISALSSNESALSLWLKAADIGRQIYAAVADERETIARMFDNDEATYGYECDNKMIAAAIRARGETK